MPIRPRRQRRRRVEWSPRVALALTIGPAPHGARLDDATLAEAWQAYGVLLLGYRTGSRLWGFWSFEPGVPDELRGGRPALYPPEHRECVRHEASELDRRRAAWLAKQPGAGRHDDLARSTAGFRS
jgi:hypothetical protein